DPTAGTCVGWPVPTVTLRIIPISDEPIAQWNDALALPPGSVGEIVVRGPMVTRAYVNRPQSNLLAKIADGEAVWHRMGDLGALDEQGRLWFYGRKSQRVQLASQCLYTEPCELVFSQHPAVYRAALVGITRGGHRAAAIVIEPQPGQMPRTTAAQARFTRELLALGAAHACTRPIQTVLFHPSFPVDIRHNAKIFREQLALWAQKHVK
ncbi:MAG: AMP-binding protein, partial [Chloroflexi bacterium SZAS-1]|nr:AMP-binding protein [Chloroflexi bacterium SZAS-1]